MYQVIFFGNQIRILHYPPKFGLSNLLAVAYSYGIILNLHPKTGFVLQHSRLLKGNRLAPKPKNKLIGISTCIGYPV